MSYESCIHYKFGNTTNYCAIKFQGLEISLSDLKIRILQANHMNHSPLEIINAQNKNVYFEESEMIPRNTSVIVKRIPPPQSNHSSKVIIASQRKRAERDMADKIQSSTFDIGNQEANLSKIDESEENRLKTMMDQASIEFDMSSKKAKNSPTIRCFRCERLGHHRDKCPLVSNMDVHSETPRKRPKGIPSTMLEIIPGDSIDKHNIKEGIYVNRKGDFVIPIVDKLAMGKRLKCSSKNSFSSSSQHFIPNELQCRLCYKIFTDAVVIQCCGNSFCDECIRTFLINNNFHCPLVECGRGEILPDNLVPNQHLRKTVKHFLANIAEEKYNSNPISSHSFSNQRKSTKVLPSFEGVDNEPFTKTTSDELSTKSPINEKLEDIQSQDSFIPIPFLFNSHNLYISSFHCNTVPSRHCESTLADSNSESFQPHEANTKNFIEPNQQISIPLQFKSENTESLCNLETQFYPLLSEKEFYLQQTLYRNKQSKIHSQCDNFNSQIALHNSFEKNHFKKQRKVSHFQSEINEDITNVSAKKSLITMKNSSLEHTDLTNTNLLQDLPDISKLSSTEQNSIPQGTFIDSPINDLEHGNIDCNLSEKLVYEPGHVFHENKSNFKQQKLEEAINWSRSPIVSNLQFEYPNYLETHSRKSSILNTDKQLNDAPIISASNLNRSQSLIDLNKNSASNILANENLFSAQELVINYGDDENEMSKSDSLQNSVVGYPDSSAHSTFQPIQFNNQSWLNCSFYKGTNNLHQCRLQSTVKKVLSSVSEDIVTLGSQENLSEYIHQETSKGTIEVPDSNFQSSEDSSELEDGQIVSSGSGGKCIPTKRKNFKLINEFPLKLEKKYPEIVNSKTSDPIFDKKYLKSKSLADFKPRSERKTPDRIVVIRPSSRPMFQRSRNNQTLLQRSKHKRPSLIPPTLPIISRNSNQHKHSRLLMTKTQDERIVEIQTTKRKLFLHSNLTFAREKLHKRKRSGYI